MYNGLKLCNKSISFSETKGEKYLHNNVNITVVHKYYFILYEYYTTVFFEGKTHTKQCTACHVGADHYY